MHMIMSENGSEKTRLRSLYRKVQSQNWICDSPSIPKYQFIYHIINCDSPNCRARPINERPTYTIHVSYQIFRLDLKYPQESSHRLPDWPSSCGLGSFLCTTIPSAMPRDRPNKVNRLRTQTMAFQNPMAF